MSDRRGPRGLLSRPPTWLFVILIAVRLLVVALVIADASRHGVDDPVVLRAERLATSPARPYLDFPVGAMPLDTVLARTLGGGGAESTAAKMALLAFVADLAAAAALWWGWGRRPAATYLLLGLPVLGFAYLRFDLVSVALAAWAIALLRRRGDDVVAGASFGLAVWAKLWPLVLLPLLWLVRARRAALTIAGILLVGGGVWYLTGGPKGPIQVLTQRGAIGWAASSTVGNLVDLFASSPAGPEGAVVRVGTASTALKGLLFAALVACEAVIWWRVVRARQPLARDPSGGTALVAVTIPLVFAPILSVQYLTWLLPWAAFAFEGDELERRVATLAAVAIAITGLLGLASPLSVPGTFLELLTLARNGLLVALVTTWLIGDRTIARRGSDAAVAQT
jgi:hypothetical protein